MPCPYCSSTSAPNNGVCRTCGARIVKPVVAMPDAGGQSPVSSAVTTNHRAVPRSTAGKNTPRIVKSPEVIVSRVLNEKAGHVLRLRADGETTWIATERGELLCWDWQQDNIQTAYQSSIHWACAEFIAANQSIICGDENGNLHCFSWRTPQQLQSLKAHSGPVSAIAVHDSLIASGGSDGTIRLYNWRTEKSAIVFQGLESVMALQFSPDGDYLAGAFDSGTLRLWKVLTPPEYSNELPQTQWEWQVARHHLWIKSLAIAPGGNALASGGYDGIVRLWAMRSGHEMQQLTLQNSVTALAFSLDNRTLASAASNTIQLWDSWMGEPLSQFSTAEPVDALHFQDNTLIVAAGRELSRWKIQ